MSNRTPSDPIRKVFSIFSLIQRFTRIDFLHSSNSPGNYHPFSDIIPDCVSIIFQYHIFNIAPSYQIKLYGSNSAYDSTSLAANRDFLSKYAHCCALGAMPSAAFVIHCRDSTMKPVFRYLRCKMETEMPLGWYVALRGIKELDIMITATIQSEHLDSLCSNIRGIRKLSINGSECNIQPHHLQNLRGIRELKFEACNLASLEEDDFGNLRGLKSLTLLRCDLELTYPKLRQLSGVEELHMGEYYCYSRRPELFPAMKGIKKLEIGEDIPKQCFECLRGIQELTIGPCESISLDQESIPNLRGLRKLHILSTGGNHSLTDDVFCNVSGVKDVWLFRLPNLTSALFEHLRGVERLRIEECPHFKFHSTGLEQLRGVKKLHWAGWHLPGCEKLLNDECMRHLHGVQILFLDQVVTQSDGAFQHLSKVRDLNLSGIVEEWNTPQQQSHPLREAAFMYLRSVEYLTLKRIRLDHVKDFHRVLSHHLPNVKKLVINKCRVMRSAVASIPEGMISSLRVRKDAEECKYVIVSFIYKRE